jgi:hypothetical protein
MKRSIGLAAVLLLVAFLAGCPYVSKVPLGVPESRLFDPRLVGVWEGFDHADSVGTITVLAFNDAEYYVETENEKGEPDRYRAFVTKIGGESFLEMNELGQSAARPEYVFARYTVTDGGDVVLRFVGEKLVPKALAANADSLGSFIAAHLADPSLDDEDMSLVMKKKR